jgi:hypothetical protein
MSKPALAVDNVRGDHAVPEVREAHDADHHPVLKHDPSDEDARLDIALDESFPTSDAPSHARPGSAGPAPSSGFNEEAEAAILRRRKRNAALRSAATIGVPIALAGGLIVGAGLWLLLARDSE